MTHDIVTPDAASVPAKPHRSPEPAPATVPGAEIDRSRWAGAAPAITLTGQRVVTRVAPVRFGERIVKQILGFNFLDIPIWKQAVTAIEWWGPAALVLLLAASVFGRLWRLSGSASYRPRERWILDLRVAAAPGRFRYFLASWLDRVNLDLARTEISAGRMRITSHRLAAQARNRQPWSYGLLHNAVIIGFAAPGVVLLAHVLLVRQSGILGDLQLVAVWKWASDWSAKLGYFTLTLLFAFLTHKSDRARGRRTGRRAKRILGLVSLRAVRTWALGALTVGAALLVHPWLAVSVAMALIFALGGPFPLVMIAAAEGGGAIFLIKDDLQRFALPVVLIGVFFIGYHMIEHRAKTPTVLTLLGLLANLVGVVALLSVFEQLHKIDRQTFAVAALFFGIFPLSLALALYLSAGLSRWTLARASRSLVLPWIVIDLALGVVLSIGYILVLIAILAMVVQFGGAPVVDLSILLDTGVIAPGIYLEDAILADPLGYLWLLVIAFAPAIPSLAGLCLGVFGLVALWPGRIGRPIARGLERGAGGDFVSGGLASLLLAGLSGGAVIAIGVLVWIAVGQVWALWPDPVIAFVAALHGVADALGAIPL